jgi:hypothetical protein
MGFFTKIRPEKFTETPPRKLPPLGVQSIQYISDGSRRKDY